MLFILWVACFIALGAIYNFASESSPALRDLEAFHPFALLCSIVVLAYVLARAIVGG